MIKVLPTTLATRVFAAAALGSAHTTATVGEGDEQYRIIAGYSTEFRLYRGTQRSRPRGTAAENLAQFLRYLTAQ